jgi:S-adenosylmethionine hydrolase
MPGPIVTLLTDFGTNNHYVGVMKGVILGINSSALVVDLCHDVSPQDVRGAAYILGASYRYFPKGTVHCSVVDPGVGSERHGLIVKTDRYFFVGPDNGLFTMVYDQEKGVEVYKIIESTHIPPEISSTFHGRDVFAPVAAHLSRGVPCSELGELISEPVRIKTLRPDLKGSILKGTVIYMDRFGNLITNITRTDFDQFTEQGGFEIVTDDVVLNSVARTYSDAPPGAMIALFGSTGHLELSAVMGSAAEKLKLRVGDTIAVRRVNQL